MFKINLMDIVERFRIRDINSLRLAGKNFKVNPTQLDGHKDKQGHSSSNDQVPHPATGIPIVQKAAYPAPEPPPEPVPQTLCRRRIIVYKILPGLIFLYL